MTRPPLRWQSSSPWATLEIGLFPDVLLLFPLGVRERTCLLLPTRHLNPAQGPRVTNSVAFVWERRSERCGCLSSCGQGACVARAFRMLHPGHLSEEMMGLSSLTTPASCSSPPSLLGHWTQLCHGWGPCLLALVIKQPLQGLGPEY